MPTPVGHALAGAAVALAAERSITIDLPRRTLFAVCVACAVAPDIDLVYQPFHRAFTHSAGAAILVMIIAVAVTARVTRRGAFVVGLVCAAAWCSHIVLDWLGADPSPPQGVKALWPFSDRWFISGVDLFLGTERRRPFSADGMRHNLQAVAREIIVMVPIVVALMLVRRGDRHRLGKGAPTGTPNGTMDGEAQA